MYQNVLLALDLADKHCWRKALPLAASLCEQYDARLHVVTVVPTLSAPLAGQSFATQVETRILEQARKQLKSFTDAQVPPAIEVMRHVGHGRIYQQIIEIAGEVEADLIVMAATNEEGSAYQLGPSTAWVARHAGCSVLIVRT